MYKYSLLIVFIFGFNLCSAQEKDEVEERIKKSEVHPKAIAWLKDAYEKRRKVKWYYQTDGKEEAFEAKLKHKKHLHSVEFNTDGIVQNIEVLIKEKEMDRTVFGIITDYMNTTYNKFSFSKIQIQYTGSEDDLEDVIDENEFEEISISYEIEYYGKTDTQNELWEGLFDQDGKLIVKRIVKIKNTDNLDY